MIEQAFEEAGYKYFANKSGCQSSDRDHYGVCTALQSFWQVFHTHALIECDEAAFRKTSEMLPVECLVVNNIFRDQLDRYGEITHTLNAIREGITHVPDATLCLNADCSLTSSLQMMYRIRLYGSGWMCRFTKRQRLNCLMQCTVFIVRQNMNTITELTSHLGGFRCPKYGYHRQTPQVGVTQVVRTGADSSDIVLNAFGHSHDVHINLPGGYNIYECGSLCCGCGDCWNR